MPTGTAAKLYSTELLSLATELSAYPLDEASPLQAEVRSRTCGSTLRISTECDDAGKVSSLGFAVSACAVGQAATTIFARSGNGCDEAAIARSLAEIENWLSTEDAPLPQWPGFSALEAAREHRGRHGALVMPWKAAIEALSKL